MSIKILPVSCKDGSSSETEYLENLTQEYERIEKMGPSISSEKMKKSSLRPSLGHLQDWNIWPGNIDYLSSRKHLKFLCFKIIKSILKFDREFTIMQNTDIKFQNLQNLTRKSQNIICLLIDSRLIKKIWRLCDDPWKINGLPH